MKKCRKPLSLRHFGTPGGGRTHGLSLRRRPLYPTELRAQIRYNPRQGRPNTFRLGGGRSILLSYGCRCKGYYTIPGAFSQEEKRRRLICSAHPVQSCNLGGNTAENHQKNIVSAGWLLQSCKNPCTMNCVRSYHGGCVPSAFERSFYHGWLC